MIRKEPISETTFSFSSSKRLLSASDYSRVFDDAPIRASHKCALILSRPNKLNYARLGLVVAKKNMRFAVARNQFKRLTRESFRLKQHQLPAIDAIVLARRGADTLTNVELSRILNGLWKHIIKQAKKHAPQSTQSEQ